MSTRFNFENHPGYEKLKEAFSRSNRDFLNSIELVPEEDVYFSPQYEKKMAHLIKRQKRPYWKYVNTVGKRIAVIAIAFMMLFGLSMSIKAIREPVIGFIENVFEKFSELFVNKSETQNAPDKIEEVYTLTDLPEGFEKNSFLRNERYVETQWSDGNFEIMFSQSVLTSKISYDVEDSETAKHIVDGIEIIYFTKYDMTYIMWHTDKYIFTVRCDYSTTFEKIVELFNSVKLD